MNLYDIIIIGGGPAGLTAAIYALRANKKVLVLEKGTFGGQITSSPKVENIPGFVSVTGNEFAEKLIEQAMNLGADVECCEALSIEDGDIKTVKTDEGDFSAKAIIIATGTKHRLLGIDGEEDFIGNGISFCAVCDGAFYEGKTVAVIGGGNSALQEAILLSDTCKKVYVVQNLDHLTGEKKLADQLYSKDNVEIITNATVKSLIADSELKGITITNQTNGEDTSIDVDGVFVAIGLIPQNEPFASCVNLNDWGYVDSDETCKTNLDGIFVAGDCRSKRIRQVATAASDGAIAALAACDYIN
ncbi:MAG: FAD-dependent oxidoreductase [Ruminococcaceae bacterium]|nr:FAD-dependent oxidoreductase [Oscillospiraceae bacterium]